MVKQIAIFTFFTLLIVSNYACKEETKIEVSPKMVLSQDSFNHFFKNKFDFKLNLVCEDLFPNFDTLSTIYQNRRNKTYWWKVLSGDSASLAQIEALFKYSNSHGMDSRYYYLPLINYFRQQALEYNNADSVYQVLSELELILSSSMLRMYEDIANGRTDPKEVYGYTYMLPRNNLKELNYKGFLKAKNKKKWIDKIHKGDTTYNEMLKVMTYYLKKKTSLESSLIDFSDYPKIELGDTAPVISEVIQRLKARNLPDKSIQEVQDTNVYTKELFAHIKVLQEKYSLTPDGIMGYKTYKLINTTPTNKIDQVRANLERQRWYTNEGSIAPFVYVNLPEYKVDLNWEDSTKSMKVCIGKNLPDNYDAMVKEYSDSGWLHKLPKNMETPQIASKFTYVVINPTWTVPYSIITREMWWRLIREPEYLSASNYKVYRGKEEVNGDTINWSRISKNRIPYTIVEQPGEKNSLGRVKYMFSNPFSIYLHDTPHKKAFERTQRAVSHGCVRLENPILFGEFLMQGSRKYDSDDFRIMMGYEPLDEERLEEYDPEDSTALIQPLDTTTKLILHKPIPLYLDYRTVYYDKDWTLHFCYDIYDQNKLIWREMDRM
jgi:murein L,D-transpeptidase YcbB/YkuD